MTLMKLYWALQQLLEDGPHGIRDHVVLMNTDGGPYALGAVKADAAMGVVWLDRDEEQGDD